MRILKLVIPSIILLFILSGCASTHWVAPQYTEVSKMQKVNKGMNISEVNTTLSIQPYDIYLKDESKTLLVYPYRLKERKMRVSDGEKGTAGKDALIKGQDWYTKTYFMYALFIDGKLEQFITDNGISSGSSSSLTNGKQKTASSESTQRKYLLIKDQKISIIDKNETQFNYLKNENWQLIPLHSVRSTSKNKESDDDSGCMSCWGLF